MRAAPEANTALARNNSHQSEHTSALSLKPHTKSPAAAMAGRSIFVCRVGSLENEVVHYDRVTLNVHEHVGHAIAIEVGHQPSVFEA